MANTNNESRNQGRPEFKAAAPYIKVVSDDVPYLITTEDMNRFIVDRMNAVLEGVRRSEPELILPDNLDDVSLVGVTGGKYYVPAFLTMPTTLLESEARKPEKKVETLYIYDSEDSISDCRLIRSFYEFINIYRYTKDDMKAYMRPEFRNALGMSASVTLLLKQYWKPRMIHVNNLKTGGSEGKAICVLLDPIRIWSAMLKNQTNPNERYKVHMKTFRMIKSGSYEFQVTRKLAKKGKVSGKDVQKELLRAISSAR